ncbi:MAG TPA: P1 family peptidase [Acidimicrobiales bacterium]|nr:P1 family peptidase [Acidimicrobiales bacterium]
MSLEAPTPVRPGAHNALTDVAGIEVGHCTRNEAPWLTGVTVVLARAGAVGAVDVRGGAPATRETDLLRPENLVEEVHAVVLSGGSAYGLGAVDGVMSWLEERGIGRRISSSPGEVVPIVPAASLFDLGRGGSFAARVDAPCGYEAAAAARGGLVAQGNVGAGTGALFAGRRLKGGIGTASAVSPAGTVAALVALNAAGNAVDLSSGWLWGAACALGEEFGPLSEASASELESFRAAGSDRGDAGLAAPGPAAIGGQAIGHTVIGVVATDVELSKTEAQRLARVAHDGLARAVRPSHTLFDGDALFALATGHRALASGAGDRGEEGVAGELRSAPPAPLGGMPAAGYGLERSAALVGICELAADCVTRSVVHAVLAARSVGPYLAYRDAFPSALRGGRAAAPASDE